MRYSVLCSVAAIVIPLAPASAADKLEFGAAASWVVPVVAPSIPEAAGDSAFTILLDNEQSLLEKGKRSYFSESMYRINTPQGLDDGNITITWDPATDVVKVHRLEIRRGSQVIDVLKSGQTFTTIRRETNLEQGMFDGQLTASILPEGLQVGDIVNWAVTYVHADPVTRDSAEVEVATFNGSPIGRGYARLSWPDSLHVSYRVSGGLAAPKVTHRNGLSTIEYDLRGIEPLVLPEHAPGRFRPHRALDASTFANWGEIAALMKPYYDSAAVIPASGPLRDEVHKIKHLPVADRAKVEAALKLVQDRVRYVALNMGAGGYVPASAETTWSRRFGDCKAKTALLLAILRELKVESEPVLANTDGNDGLDAIQPMLGAFNHVLVRAHLGGKSYWLDGTGSGDLSLDRLQTPAYDWGLPVLAKAAALVRMVPEPLKQPTVDVTLAIDARAGIALPAPTTIDYVMRGELGRNANIKYNGRPPSQRERFLRDFFKSVSDDWKSSVVSLTPDSVSAKFDPSSGDLRLSLVGKAKLDWTDSNFYMAFSSLAYKPKFERTEGINRDAPVAIDYPLFTRLVETVRLPPAFLESTNTIPDINATAVGMEYHRHAAFVGDAFTVETTERAIMPEVPYAQAIAESARLRELNSNYLSVNVPINYRPSDQELSSRLAEKLTTVSQFIDRGVTLLDRGRYTDAIADFTAALAIDGKNSAALGDRALSYLFNDDKVRARADIAAGMAIDPKEAVVNRARGLLAEKEQRWPEAIESFTASLAKDPGNSFAMGHRAIALTASDRFDEALTDSTSALEKQPDWDGLRTVRAGILLKRHRCDDVIKEADAIIATAGDDPDVLASGITLYYNCHRRDQAIAILDKRIAAKPTARALVMRGSLRPPSDAARRLADYDAAVKLDPKKPVYLLVKADEIDRQGEAAAALALYDQALKLEPDDFGVSVKRAILLHRLGRADEAAKLFAALRLKAKTASELNNLCWDKATANIMLDSALVECNDALKLSPDAPGTLDSLGMALLRLGRYDDAIKAYDKAIAKGLGAISLMGRSIAYARKGDSAKAEADRKAALSDDPDIADRARRYGLPFQGEVAAR